MEIRKILIQNWFTHKPDERAWAVTLVYGFILFGTFLLQITDTFHAASWLPASAEKVFVQHEYWRLWTSLFAHGDMGHILSNAIILLPFSFWLSSYFGPFLWPFLGILLGGVTNALVLTNLPPTTNLIGISGVVYWVGAAYMTLYVLIDRRKSLKRRLASMIFVTMMLFVPETYHNDVSYSSHFIGYILGMAAAVGYYAIYAKTFHDAEEYDYTIDHDFETDLEYNSTDGGSYERGHIGS